jgi:pyridoxal phosphate enzyme (YggS family)
MPLDLPAAAIRIRENFAGVRGKIASAAGRSGRTADAITLVGVTKYVEPPVARLLAEAGLKTLGESRPQQLWAKQEALADLNIKWHLIGHLQRNKVKRTLRLVQLIHSADSQRLLEAINIEAAAQGLAASVLLEVNVSGDASKTGMPAMDVEQLLPAIPAMKAIRVMGLMTMAALEGGADTARRDFTALRELRDKLRANCPPTIELNELSMGMSGDYEVAIEEGATIIRVGSALFEGLE